MLQQRYAAKLSSSGLNQADAKALQLQLTSGKQLGLTPPQGGVKIPYFNPDGSAMAYYRFRYLEDTRSDFERKTDLPPLRYTQPPGSGVQVYLPPINDLNWAALLADPTQPLIITEGELKAAAACKHDFPTIGLGGVWSFAVGGAPIPTLAAANWQDRRVFIVYDSDVATNAQVCKAEQRLAATLGAWGARPCIVRLPPPPPPAIKVGLDDYLLAQGPDALQDLLTAATPIEQVAALHFFNTQVVVIRELAAVMERSTGHLMGKHAFCEINYAQMFHHENIVTTKGAPSRKRVKTAPVWLEWEGREEANRLTFAPGAPRMLANGDYNSWQGWGARPHAASVAPWEELLAYALQDLTPPERKWFVQWCAYPLQHPGAKLATACIFHGMQEGTGKTFIGLSLKEIYGVHGIQIGETDLHDARNEWMVNMQFVLGDEVTGSDKYHMIDRLKGMITQKEVRVNIKYVKSYSIPDCINYFFTSNRCNSFILGSTARRYFVNEMNNAPLPFTFYREYEKWLWRASGAHALHAHLLQVDLTGFNPQAPAPTTTAKVEMEILGRSDIEEWVRELLASPAALKKDFYTNAEIMMLYDPAGKGHVKTNTLGRVLKEANVWRAAHGHPVQWEGKSYRLYCLKNVEKWRCAPQSQIMRNYLGVTK